MLLLYKPDISWISFQAKVFEIATGILVFDGFDEIGVKKATLNLFKLLLHYFLLFLTQLEHFLAFLQILEPNSKTNIPRFIPHTRQPYLRSPIKSSLILLKHPISRMHSTLQILLPLNPLAFAPQPPTH